MKKILCEAITGLMVMSLAACGGSGKPSATSATTAAAATTAAPETTAVPETAAPAAAKAEPVEITLFAAASMTETMDEIIKMYKEAAPEVTVVPTYDSSGTLLTQIKEGADCNMFISAAQKQINALDGSLKDDAEKNSDGIDMLEEGTRVNLLENKAALVVPDGNPAGIEKFEDIASDKLKLIALGNSDVPVGSYSLDILAFLGLDVAELEAAGKVTYGSNVKEVTTQVSEGAVDCGIIYATDAFSAGLTVVDTAAKDMCKQVIYPAAVIRSDDQAKTDAAKAFLEYLHTDDCTKVFESVGFSVIR